MKTVIEMAVDAGGRAQQNKNCDVEYLMDAEALERFAELVRADERARMAEQEPSCPECVFGLCHCGLRKVERPAQPEQELVIDCPRCGHCCPQQPKQEPVNEGRKLVPVEPTEDMWKAVNKLDDEMAAGSYDGKGCSIEQAWNCLLAAAPQPAQRTWVGLSEEEKQEWIGAMPYDIEPRHCMILLNVMEVQLKQRNT